MALTTTWRVKVPYRVRFERGQVAMRQQLWIMELGTSNEAEVWATETADEGETLEQPLYSLSDGRFPGYVRPGRYDVYLGDAVTPIQWDAIAFRSQSFTINTDGAPSFTNSWVNYGTGHQAAGFQKDAFGMVRLFGAVKNGTVSTGIFTLPVGYRPSAPAATPNNYHVASLASAGVVMVGDDGVVKGPASNTFVPLDGITFKAGA